jgi:2-polyprenyl-3-methyl-5-hydroxy-6-metoxy-1,4-benzoquinol methylase
MPKPQGARQAVDSTLRRAAAFLARHPSEKEVHRTYGYFTRHLVAPLNQKRLTLILSALSQRSEELGRPLKVLDLACGGGVITCAVATMGHRALGMDLSPEEIRLAKLFAQEEKLGGLFWQTDLLQDAFWEKTAEETLGGKPDAVVLAYALHHLPQVEFFVDRLSRWLPQGTLVLVNEENLGAPLFRLKHVVRTWLQADTEVEAHRNFQGWKELLETRGFKVSGWVGTDILPGISRISPRNCWSLVFSATKL